MSEKQSIPRHGKRKMLEFSKGQSVQRQLRLRSNNQTERPLSATGLLCATPRSKNPTPQEMEPPRGSPAEPCGDNFVVVMVGLPARGKTYVARRTAHYLQFFHGAKTKVFNVGQYRRKYNEKAKCDFFDHSNKTAMEIRRKCAEEAMKDMISFLTSAKVVTTNEVVGRVAFFDATNTTKARRSWILSELNKSGAIESSTHVIFLESICEDQNIIDTNISVAKVSMPDYKGMKAEDAVADFKARIQKYEQVYVTIDDPKVSYIKLFDGGRKVTINNIRGFLPGRLVQFVMNLHTTPRPVFFTRHGRSEYNVLNKIGGDSVLSKEGEVYARKLANFAESTILKEFPHCRLWTSSLVHCFYLK